MATNKWGRRMTISIPHSLCVALMTLLVLTAAACTPDGSNHSKVSDNAPPSLKVTLTPHTESGTIQSLQVHMELSAPDVARGDVLLRMPIELVSTPTAAYTAEQVHVHDDRGVLAVRVDDEEPTASGQYRNYVASRATVGNVTVDYATPPRHVDKNTRNGPLFDLRTQQGGLMGAGVYFMALPPGDTPWDIHLQWDLSALGAGAHGVWSMGEGEQEIIAPAETLRFSYYAVGNMHRMPEEEGNVFHLYWMDPPPFDPEELAAKTGRLYRYMAKFFGDEGAAYRMFARKNPYPAGGGTALAHSFMFGYGPKGTTIADGLQALLAHEMAHTWPKLDGDDHAMTAWYTEGTAEFYSIVLSRRSGVFGQDEFLAAINDRVDGYYDNPYRTLSNRAAGKRFWSDAGAQRVPYGRGFMYLVNLDTQLSHHGREAHSVDDLVLEVLRRQQDGESVGLREWRAMVVRELGQQAGETFDAMTRGQLIIPAGPAFGCYRVVSHPHHPFDLGFDRMRMGVVSDLDPDSAAARAGVRENDIIVDYTPLDDVKSSEETIMHLKVQRDGKTLKFDYLPRRQRVTAWRFVLDSALKDRCDP